MNSYGLETNLHTKRSGLSNKIMSHSSTKGNTQNNDESAHPTSRMVAEATTKMSGKV